jgi:hypothetical protein
MDIESGELKKADNRSYTALAIPANNTSLYTYTQHYTVQTPHDT